MTKVDRLDCLLLGHYSPSTSAAWETARMSQSQSGTYGYVKTNTIALRDGRRSYGQLLNEVLFRSTGKPSSLHVANLPHLGCCYLKSFLSKAGFQASIVNYVNQDSEQLDLELGARPLAVAITTTLYTDNQPCVELVQRVREGSPDSVVIVGGPHIFNVCSEPSRAAQDAVLQQIGADVYVFESQGEATLVRILAALRSGSRKFDDIPNLVYRDSAGAWCRTERVREDNDLDENAVDWSVMPENMVARAVQMRTARSCPFACSFCRYPLMGGPLRLSKIETIRKELRQLRALGVENVSFIDDTFNLPRERFVQINNMIIEEQFGFNWYSYLRCSNLGEGEAELMAASGCRGVFLGIESGDDGVLSHMNKKATVKQLRAGIERLHRCGIPTFACFIVGFPGETKETVKNTLAFIEETAPTFYRAELYFHDPGAPIQKRAPEFGIKSRAFTWVHRSMRWQEAQEHIIDIYRHVKNSTIMPIMDFDFWSLPYYAGAGLSLDKIHGFATVAGEMLRGSLDDSALNIESYEGRLRRALLGPAHGQARGIVACA